MKSLYRKMVSRMGLWNIPQPEFLVDNWPSDKKYKSVAVFPSDKDDISWMLWLQEYHYAVDIKFLDGKTYIAFEDDAAALIFKIKFL